MKYSYGSKSKTHQLPLKRIVLPSSGKNNNTFDTVETILLYYLLISQERNQQDNFDCAYNDWRWFYDCDGPRDTAWQSLVTRSVTGRDQGAGPGVRARDNAVTTFCCHTLPVPLLLPADHDSVAEITDCSEHMTTIRSTGLLSDKRENVCDLRIKAWGGSARWWIRVSLSSDVEWCHFDNDCDSDGRRERQLAFKWWPSPLISPI